MCLQLLRPASPESVDAPAQFIFFVYVIGKVNNGCRRLQLRVAALADSVTNDDRRNAESQKSCMHYQVTRIYQESSVSFSLPSV